MNMPLKRNLPLILALVSILSFLILVLGNIPISAYINN
jgi:hypothetical protein